jgi:hypothetical protein
MLYPILESDGDKSIKYYPLPDETQGNAQSTTLKSITLKEAINLGEIL